jgi:hypothetical protein
LEGIVGFVRDFWGGILQAAGTAIKGEEPVPAVVTVPAVPEKDSGVPVFMYAIVGALIALLLKGNKR